MSARDTIAAAISAIRVPDAVARHRAFEFQAHLTKPAGALGRLEELHIWAAGIRREATPVPGAAEIIVAAADAGVADERVSAYPQAVTAAMVRNFLDGGAAINVLARQAHARLTIVDCGVASDIDDARLVVCKRGFGAANITGGPAMTRDDAEALIAAGINIAAAAAGRGATAVGLGDMGIANTTSAAAMTALYTGTMPRDVAGRGTGVDDTGLRRKVAAIERALQVNAPTPNDPVGVVAALGGCETALLAGVILGGAAHGVPVVLDGYPTTAAALVATSMAPACREYLLASHLSAEPGHRHALAHLQLRPLLDLDLRLGEGTGAALALALLDAALRIPRGMATFASAAVPDKQQDAVLER